MTFPKLDRLKEQTKVLETKVKALKDERRKIQVKFSCLQGEAETLRTENRRLSQENDKLRRGFRLFAEKIVKPKADAYLARFGSKAFDHAMEDYKSCENPDLQKEVIRILAQK